MRMKIRTFFLWRGIGFLLVLCFLIIASNQQALFAHHKERYFSPAAQTTTLKSGKELKPFLLGFDTFMADMYWLRAIQYVGGNALSNEFPVLEGYMNTITDFDPHFAHAYHFGGILLPATQKYEAARALLLKGEKNMPEEWQLPYDLGFLSFYYLEDYDAAIAAYERCLQKEGCLKGAKSLVNSLRARTGKTDLAFLNLLEQLGATLGQTAPLQISEEQRFLIDKVEEIGKLFLLEQLAAEQSPQQTLEEYVGKKVRLEENRTEGIVVTERFFQTAALLQDITGKKVLSAESILLPELVVTVFPNPYVWDQQNQKVRLSKW